MVLLRCFCHLPSCLFAIPAANTVLLAALLPLPDCGPTRSPPACPASHTARPKADRGGTRWKPWLPHLTVVPLSTPPHTVLPQTTVVHGADVVPTICPATADALREEMARRWGGRVVGRMVVVVVGPCNCNGWPCLAVLRPPPKPSLCPPRFS